MSAEHKTGSKGGLFHACDMLSRRTAKFFALIALVSLCLHLAEGKAEGCAACDAAGKLARESENKAFYVLRILYEKKGQEALPFVRRALAMEDNPAAQMRAVAYVAELKDEESMPQLERIMAEVYKRVSFSEFGIETIDFISLKTAAVPALFAITLGGASAAVSPGGKIPVTWADLKAEL